ncbi:RNA-binding protein YlmH [Evansella vedderi]|uniref:RNA-binding protein YlmH n=1 Tax=Evansella vedderi TaxID=38282 RepID=A0ABT9ZRD1_9BACI|nr:RNA-binding protein [Evansella vedderi]MDQ0253801.1 RNA-binding protein YlmH [Evansella vedderi]
MSVYEHYRKEEHSFVDQVMEWKGIVIEEYRWKLTDFLDPRQQEIVRSIIGQNEDVKYAFWGGHEHAERQRCLLYPPYLDPSEDDFEVTVFDLEYPSKFVQIEHRQILGALMNVGLKREKFGDILTDGERFQVVLSSEVSDFITWNLTSVGKAKVSLKGIPTSDVISVEQDYSYLGVTVSSLRLDTVISEVYKLSRSKAKPLIEGGYVKVNWKVVDDPSFSLEVKDVISVRGKGRSVLMANDGQTKKGKIRLTFGIPK